MQMQMTLCHPLIVEPNLLPCSIVSKIARDFFQFAAVKYIRRASGDCKPRVIRFYTDCSDCLQSTSIERQ